MKTDDEIKATIGRKLATELGIHRARIDNAGRPVKEERYRIGDNLSDEFGLMSPVGVYAVVQRLAKDARKELASSKRYKKATGGS